MSQKCCTTLTLKTGAGGSSGYSRSIQSSHRVLGVPRVLKLDEREARRVARDPHVAQVSVLSEGVLDLVFGGTVAQISDVNLALQVPVAGGHGSCFVFLKR